MDIREQKALEISCDNCITFIDGAWHVHSQTGTETYAVRKLLECRRNNTTPRAICRRGG
jgi:hypothetical protein